MNKVILSAAVIATLSFTSCKDEPKADLEKETELIKDSKEMAMTDLSFGVRGNCGMCKTTIETAVSEVEGVTDAHWDVEKKKIEVSFDNSETDELAIHNAIAASGYDTEKVEGDLEAYESLPGCCKYDRDMEMNQ